MDDVKERTTAFDPAANADEYKNHLLHIIGPFKEEMKVDSINSPDLSNTETENVSAEPLAEGVGWDGPADEMNPLNWESRKKWRMVGVVSIMTFIT
jgi:hypothetical protein